MFTRGLCWYASSAKGKALLNGINEMKQCSDALMQPINHWKCVHTHHFALIFNRKIVTTYFIVLTVRTDQWHYRRTTVAIVNITRNAWALRLAVDRELFVVFLFCWFLFFSSSFLLFWLLQSDCDAFHARVSWMLLKLRNNCGQSEQIPQTANL